MKKTLLITIVSAMMGIGGAAYGVQSLTFNDLGLGGGDAISGTYNSTDTFSFDVSLTFSGYTSTGLSFWLETATGFAGNLSITGVTYGTAFPDPTQTLPDPAPFDVSSGASAGFMTEARDLGSTENAGPVAAGTYFVAHITFSITGAAPGTYTLRSTITSPHTSEVTDSGFQDNSLGATSYTITIVPEPSTAALIALTLAGVGVIAHRRRALRG